MKFSWLSISCVITVLSAPAFAGNDCFIYEDGGKTVADGACTRRHPPQSTFKIAISLMGFNEGVLIDETHPVVAFKEGYADDIEDWKQPHNPTLWIKNSCVWFSRFVTNQMGAGKFKGYIKRFKYGNEDVSGDKGKNNGLTNSWITSSLSISPAEQIKFLNKFLQSKLPVSETARRYTRGILYREQLPDGWRLYGKTGSGDLLNPDGSHDRIHERGWFVGWIENGNRRIVFAQYLEIKNVKDASSGFGYIASKKARELAKERLQRLVAPKESGT